MSVYKISEIRLFVAAAALALLPLALPAQLDAPHFKVFRFPSDRIPRIDGQFDDWDMVPESYVVGTEELWDDSGKHPGINKESLDIRVKVGWVKGLNRLYFMYEAYDDYWDFTHTGLHNDIFEVVVDGDLSGGPHIDERHPNRELNQWDAYFLFHGVHAQNYHVFTPPAYGKDWTLAWGSQPWIKDLPYANAAFDYHFKPGEPGILRLEFYITVFDYAGNDPSRAVESQLYDNKSIGLCWAVIDYDDVNRNGNNGFWNLSKHHTMYGESSQLRTFDLMPLEPQFKKALHAGWEHKIVDMRRRMVAFNDLSEGNITRWKWDFGDGTTSEEQHPLHAYEQAGKYVVVLDVFGPDGTDRAIKVWDVAVK
ncbi:MAG: PKD domain-containing protein [Tannerella sp.]|nr:PKD domain-containing protein [Tannerella sp.]